jgi:lambda family phage portal protein
MGFSTDNIVSALTTMADPPKSKPVPVTVRPRPLSVLEQFEDQQVADAMRMVATGSPLAMSRLVNGPQTIHARYDSAQHTEETRRHWLMADGMAADASMNVGVREVLRRRSRYEVANNCYACGLVQTIANDVIGTGPTLHMLLENEDMGNAIEEKWRSWCRKVHLAQKLRTMRKSKAQDGETFGLLVENPTLDYPVRADLRLVEADQVRTTDISLYGVPCVDGIKLDQYGNPENYHILREHPGNYSYWTGTIGFPWEYANWPATSVIHWFRADRPGQHRGIPEITPALPLYAQLRRFTQATLDAAESAAHFALVMQTNAPASGQAAAVNPGEYFELMRNMALTLPEGWTLGQTDPKHPATTYEMFKRELIREIARCLGVPYNIAAGDSSNYNYASGRLDHQTYFRMIRIEQLECEELVLDRIFEWWFSEAILVSDYLPVAARALPDHPHQWFWDNHEHVDPAKEANAQATKLADYTTNLAEEWGKKGIKWKVGVAQRAKEIAYCASLGIPANLGPGVLPPATPVTPGGTPPPDVDDAPDKDEDAE